MGNVLGKPSVSSTFAIRVGQCSKISFQMLFTIPHVLEQAHSGVRCAVYSSEWGPEHWTGH